MLTEQLFEGQHVRFTPPDAERDAEIVSKWTHDPEYLRLLSADIARPLSPFQVKKQYEEWEKNAEKHTAFNFAVRLKEDDRLVGFARLYRIEWAHRVARARSGHCGARGPKTRAPGA